MWRQGNVWVSMVMLAAVPVLVTGLVNVVKEEKCRHWKDVMRSEGVLPTLCSDGSATGVCCTCRGLGIAPLKVEECKDATDASGGER